MTMKLGVSLATLLASASLLIGLQPVRGQLLQVERSVNGAAFVTLFTVVTSDGTGDISINHSQQGVIVTYRISDPDTIANDSVGTLTLTGAIGNGEIQVLFGKGVRDSDATFPSLPSLLLDEGLLHLGTPGQPVIVYGSTDLRDRTRVAAAA
jgi:hypothetical protein